VRLATPASCIVGTWGKTGERVGLITPNAVSAPSNGKSGLKTMRLVVKNEVGILSLRTRNSGSGDGGDLCGSGIHAEAAGGGYGALGVADVVHHAQLHAERFRRDGGQHVAAFVAVGIHAVRRECFHVCASKPSE
jgi:hypothetical protein